LFAYYNPRLLGCFEMMTRLSHHINWNQEERKKI